MPYSQVELTARSEWDAFVETVSPAAFFQCWSWGDVLKRQNVACWRFGWMDRKTLVAVAQIAVVRARRGTFLHVRHGPVVKSTDVELWKQIATDITNIAKKERVWFVRLGPLLSPTPQSELFLAKLGARPSAIHAMDAERCWVLNLVQSEAQILAGMRKTTRYEVNKAEKLGVQVTESTKKADLDKFLILYEATARRQNFVEHKEVIEEFLEFCGQGAGSVWLATYEGQVLAGAIIIYQYGQAIYHHGASIPGKIPASYALQWAIIRAAKQRGIKQYNFWGIAPEGKPNHPWQGLTLFKTGFGGGAVEFLHAHDIPLTPMYAIPRAVEWWRATSKHY